MNEENILVIPKKITVLIPKNSPLLKKNQKNYKSKDKVIFDDGHVVCTACTRWDYASHTITRSTEATTEHMIQAYVLRMKVMDEADDGRTGRVHRSLLVFDSSESKAAKTHADNCASAGLAESRFQWFLEYESHLARACGVLAGGLHWHGDAAPRVQLAPAGHTDLPVVSVPVDRRRRVHRRRTNIGRDVTTKTPPFRYPFTSAKTHFPKDPSVSEIVGRNSFPKKMCLLGGPAGRRRNQPGPWSTCNPRRTEGGSGERIRTRSRGKIIV